MKKQKSKEVMNELEALMKESDKMFYKHPFCKYDILKDYTPLDVFFQGFLAGIEFEEKKKK